MAEPRSVKEPDSGHDFRAKKRTFRGVMSCIAKTMPLCVTGLALGAQAAQPAPELSRRPMQAIIEFLSSDLLEGRAPGTRGGALAEAYVQSLFKLWDLEPGAGAGYLQEVPLKGYSTKQLTVEAASQTLKLGEDVMGTYAADEGSFDLSAPALFVGFGIATPLWEWDDFKDADVKGSFLIARVNDPGLFIDGIFEGKTLTYFGRWTYHVEEALRRGAAGLLLIHTDETAGYGWNVVQNSWGGESLHLRGEVDNALKFRGWVKEESLKRVLARKGIDLQKLYQASLSRDFKPVALGFSIRVRGRQSVRELTAHNVVADIPGRVKERIVLSAHIDHIGMKDSPRGDKIFNGAVDNGSAVAALLLTAKALKDRQKELYYSVTVLACQAEEAGMLGSKHFVRAAAPGSIVADINFEATPVWERAGSIMGVGARYSTLEDLLKVVAKKRGWGYSEFSLVEQGFFYRSDQFSFARAGIPAVWISAGEDDASGERKYSAFWKTDYHTPKDEFHPDWPLGGLAQTVAAALDLVAEIDGTREAPRWKGMRPFATTAGTGKP